MQEHNLELEALRSLECPHADAFVAFFGAFARSLIRCVGTPAACNADSACCQNLLVRASTAISVGLVLAARASVITSVSASAISSSDTSQSSGGAPGRSGRAVSLAERSFTSASMSRTSTSPSAASAASAMA